MMTSAIVLAAALAADLSGHVDPFIGTDGDGHCFPAACVPFGMVQAGPDTGHGEWKYCSGYQWKDRKFIGFSQTHLNGTGCPDLGDLRILPLGAGKDCAAGEDVFVEFEKSSEKAEPGYYAATLKDPAVVVEISASAHGAIYRMKMLGDGPLNMLVEPRAMIKDYSAFKKRPTKQLAFDLKKDAEGGIVEMSGAYRTSCWVVRDVGYCVVFDRPARGVGRNLYAFDMRRGETLTVKVGLSSRADGGRARQNLMAEIGGWDFEGVKAAARAEWNRVFAAATVEGTDEQKKNWYTSLYHLYTQPNNIADVGERPFYSTLSTWDTFRAAGPLYTILSPDKAEVFVDSMLEQGRRTGYLPIWTLWGKDNQCMIATHSIPMIVDWFLKEVNDTNRKNDRLQYWLSAYAQVKDTLTNRHPGRIKEDWAIYDKCGYYPCDVVKGESVSRTLECGYDDWCAGVMAQKLGLKADAEFFFRRSEYWRNHFDERLGVMRGKSEAGRWREPFNPYEFGHGAENDNDFTEGNAFQYTWHVMQNPSGLISAFGGAERFVRKLDEVFSWKPGDGGAIRFEHATNKALTVDVTGMIGQYVHGNEPSHHVPYFYTLAGRPDRAAEVVREVFDRFYYPRPDGLCGNDDCGQMSAWYLFGAMGFYPFNPCGGEYVIGAPQVEKVVLNNTFTIIARNLSRENKYVKSVTLNGRPVADWRIRHRDIMRGGELAFEMAAEPK